MLTVASCCKQAKHPNQQCTKQLIKPEKHQCTMSTTSILDSSTKAAARLPLQCTVRSAFQANASTKPNKLHCSHCTHTSRQVKASTSRVKQTTHNATRRHASQACNHWSGRSQPQHGSRQGRPARARFLVSTSKCHCDHFHLPCHHNKKSHLRQAASPVITSPRQSNDLRDNAWTQSTLTLLGNMLCCTIL